MTPTPEPNPYDEAHAAEPGAGVTRAEMFARAAADHALAAFQAIGQLAAENAATRAELADYRREVAALRDELRQGFGTLRDAIRDMRRTRADLAELTDEIEDTKIRALKKERDAARVSVARLRKVAVGLASTVAAGVALAALLRWLHL